MIGEEALILVIEIVSVATAVLAAMIFLFIRKHSKLQRKQKALEKQLAQTEQSLENIYHEVHDNIGQALTLAKLNLHTVEPHLPEHVNEKLRDSRDLIGKAITDLRQLSKNAETEAITETPSHKYRDCTVGISKTAV